MENKDSDRLSLFKSFYEDLVGKNEAAYQGSVYYPSSVIRPPLTKDTLKDIQSTIENGSVQNRIELSKKYFLKNGFYKRIILHYATLYKYTGLLIPNFNQNVSLSKKTKNRYYKALDFIENVNLADFCYQAVLTALVEGSFYGVVSKLDDKIFSYIQLPSKYCQSLFKDEHGREVIQFDVKYFDSIIDPLKREEAFKVYPSVITAYYKKWKNGKLKTSWVVIPPDLGICFTFCDGMPFFLSILPALLDYDDVVEIVKDKEKEETKKIVVQHIPHNTSTNELVFEPPEAEEMHFGSVSMLKNNKNIDVLTTYADVDVVSSRTDNTEDHTIEQTIKNIYNEAGISQEIFCGSTKTTTELSLRNDMALMAGIINNISYFITSLINQQFGDKNISFKYTILSITHFNEKEVIENSFKLAASGYSYILPSLIYNLTQRDTVNLKVLENDVLNLKDLLIPLQSSYTQSADSGGAPTKTTDKKADTTITREENE